MAIFSPSSVVGSISGNVGGACFVNSKGAKVLRKAKRNNASVAPKTFQKGSESRPAEPKHQSTFANAVRAWRTLTLDQQNAWRTYAIATPVTNRLGFTSPLSGYQVFLKNRLFNFNPLDTPAVLPPLPDDVPLVAPLSLAWDLSDGLRYTVGQGPVAGTIKIQLSGMPLYTNSIPAHWSRFRVFGDLSAAQNSSFLVTNTWLSNFPLPVENQVVAFRTRFIHDNNTFRGESVQIIRVTDTPAPSGTEVWSPTAVTGTATGLYSYVNMLRGSAGQDNFYVSYTDNETKNYTTFAKTQGATEMIGASIITEIRLQCRYDNQKDDECAVELWFDSGSGLAKQGATKIFTDSSNTWVYEDEDRSDVAWQGLSLTFAQYQGLEVRTVFNEGQGGEGRMTVVNISADFE